MLTPLAILIGLLSYSFSRYSNKNFNNFSNWQIKPAKKIGLFTRLTIKELAGPDIIGLNNDERYIAGIDFLFYPPGPTLFESFYTKCILVTTRNIILARYSISFKNLRYKIIPFSGLKDVLIKKFLVKQYLVLILHSGEIYQIALNKRLLDKELVAYHDRIIKFFIDKEYLHH
jgi:hypothetical protein